MHPDLSPHLHTEECNQIIQKLIQCRANHRVGKWFGQCSREDRDVWDCLKKEDFSKFSDTDFDPKDWINQTFKLPEAQKNREQHAQALVMKLQLFIQEVNKSLEETSHQIVQTMPRILREIESTQQEAVLLQNRMKSVQQDVRKVEHDTASAMDSLLKIDTVKSRMQGVERALREIDNWSGLTSDIDEVFASGNLDLMANRLAALQKCLRVIGQKVPDFKDRNDYLERLKDQFVSLVSPSVVSALTSHSAETVQYFSEMFTDLDRIADLQQYYHTCLKADLNKSWSELLSSEASNDLNELLSCFYDKLLSIWFSQLKWCGQAFKQPAPMLCTAITLALKQLEPSVNSVMTEKMDAVDDKLGVLVQVKEGMDSFVKSLNSSFQSVGLSVESGEAKRFHEAVYSSLIPFLLNYQHYQQSALLGKLNQWNFDSNDFGDNVVKLQKSVQQVFAEALQTIDQCHALTNSLGLPLLIKGLQNYFTNYVTKAKKVVEFVGAEPKGQEVTEMGDDVTGGQVPSGKFKEENWDRLGQILNLVKFCGCLLLDLERLDEALLVMYVRSKDTCAQAGIMAKFSEERLETRIGNLSPMDALLMKEKSISAGMEQLIFKIGEDVSPKFLPDIEKQLARLNQRSLKLASEQIFGPIESLLESVPKISAWCSATLGESLAQTLPTFSLAPQEYITKVGQYLMTFAHHLEPYLSSDDTEMCASLRKGSLPYVKIEKGKPENSEQAVQIWLECAGEGVMLRYAEVASRIRELSQSGAQQLATDIDYLCNVMEDLGLAPSESLAGLRDLLKMDPKLLKSGPEGYPAPLVAAVKEMRKVK